MCGWTSVYIKHVIYNVVIFPIGTHNIKNQLNVTSLIKPLPLLRLRIVNGRWSPSGLSTFYIETIWLTPCCILYNNIPTIPSSYLTVLSCLYDLSASCCCSSKRAWDHTTLCPRSSCPCSKNMKPAACHYLLALLSHNRFAQVTSCKK